MNLDSSPLAGLPTSPESPDVYGYLSLDARGHWRLRGDTIGRDSLITHLNAHYQADDEGRWFVQNGWQRVFVTLAYTPWVLRVSGEGRLVTHTGLPVFEPRAAFLDETGALLLATPLGASLIDDNDLGWALERLSTDRSPLDEHALSEALALDCGRATKLRFAAPSGALLPVTRINRAQAATTLGFVPRPVPRGAPSPRIQ